MTRDEKVEKLTHYDMERAVDDPGMLFDVFSDGCRGYYNMSDEEINGYYSDFFEN